MALKRSGVRISLPPPRKNGPDRTQNAIRAVSRSAPEDRPEPFKTARNGRVRHRRGDHTGTNSTGPQRAFRRLPVAPRHGPSGTDVRSGPRVGPHFGHAVSGAGRLRAAPHATQDCRCSRSSEASGALRTTPETAPTAPRGRICVGQCPKRVASEPPTHRPHPLRHRPARRSAPALPHYAPPRDAPAPVLVPVPPSFPPPDRGRATRRRARVAFEGASIGAKALWRPTGRTFAYPCVVSIRA